MAVRRLPTAGQAVRIQAAVPDASKGKRGKAGHNRTEKILSGQNFYRWCFPILFYPIVLAACSFFVRLDGAWFAQLLKPSFLLPNFYLSLLTIPVYGCLAAALWFLVRAPGAGKQVLEMGFSALFQLLWCVFFFMVKAPFAALLVNVLLLIHSAILMAFIRKKSPKSFYFMMPFYAFLIYIASVCYVILMLY